MRYREHIAAGYVHVVEISPEVFCRLDWSADECRMIQIEYAGPVSVMFKDEHKAFEFKMRFG